ncbi:MAG: hypothetical protein NC081_04775 [Roseburia sp.]|nr:hypothetical protein [Roseburia sp.]
MKKWQRRGIAMILTAALAFTALGCGGSPKETGTEGDGGSSVGAMGGDGSAGATAKGRYMETQLDIPTDFQRGGCMAKLSDGTLAVVDTLAGIKYTSSDEGQTWQEDEIAALQRVLSAVEGEYRTAIAPDGGIFIEYIDWYQSSEEKLYPEKFLYVAPDGSETEFELGLEEYHASVTKMAFSTRGRLFAATNSDVVYEIDIQNRSAKKLFELAGAWDLAMWADSKRLMLQDGQQVYFYSLDTGEYHTEDAVLNDFIKEQNSQKTGIVLCSGEGEQGEDTVFLASVGGIYCHVAGGSVMEQLADGALNNLGDPTKTPISMLQMDEKAFLILYDDGELYSYIYDPEALAVPEEQISIYGLYDNETVRRAVSVFRKENPDVFVRFEIGISGEDGMTENDAIHNLNTRLLADEGPDLLLLNGLPLDSYKEKGILADLKGETESLKSTNAFFEGVLEGYGDDKGIYALPFRYEIPCLSGAEGKVSSVVDLGTLADAVERIAAEGNVKETILGTYTGEELLEKIYRLCADSWITENGSVDKEKLGEFLTDAKRIYTSEQANLKEEAKAGHEESRRRLQSFYTEEEMKLRRLGVYDQVINQLMGEQILSAGYLRSMSDYKAVVSVGRQWEDTSEAYRIKAWSGQSAGTFCPTGIIGLSANTKDPETAKAFLRTLFREDVQKVDLGDGFPVNEDAFEIFTTQANPNETYSLGFSGPDGAYLGLEIVWPNEGEVEELREIIQASHTPVGTDSLLEDDIIAIGVKALTGEKEIDECVEEIVQKISLRMQE